MHTFAKDGQKKKNGGKEQNKIIAPNVVEQ